MKLRRLPQPEDGITSTEKKHSQPKDKTSTKTYKKRRKKINRTHKRNKIREKTNVNKELIMFYQKMKARIQTCRIYCLKKQLNVLRTVVDIQNKELSCRVQKDDLKNGLTLSRAIDSDHREVTNIVQSDDQSERAAIGGNAARNPSKQIVRDRTTSIPVNLRLSDVTHAVDRTKQKSYNKVKMYELNDEEDKLRQEYKKLLEIYDAETRKRTRIVKLKMIAAIPKLPKPKIDEAEEKAIQELDEMEILHNCRHERNKIVNMIAQATNKKGNTCVEIDATLNLTYDPINIDIKNETIMVIMMIKGDEASIRADLVRDADVQSVNQIRTMIPRSQHRLEEIKKSRCCKRDRDSARGNVLDTEDEISTTTRQPETTMAETDEQIPSASGSTATKGSRKRVISYKETSSTTSKSPEEEPNQSESEEEIKKKRKRTSSKKNPEGKAKIPKTRAKDGRKLVDLSNRIRDSRGRYNRLVFQRLYCRERLQPRTSNPTKGKGNTDR